MIIERLKISEGLFNNSDDEFSNVSNLLYSNDNSVGKTTYLRILLYSLGYTIPNMFGLDFSNLNLELWVNEKGKKYIIKRIKDILYVETQNNKEEYILPNEHMKFLSELFDTENINVLDNVLGIMYVDQEKGWTLLNRGTVIGKNKFNIDSLLLGLGEIDCEEEIQSKEYYENENIKASALLDIKKLQDKILENNNEYSFSSYEKELVDKIEFINLNISKIKDDIRKIDEVLRKNKNIYEYISQMGLYVLDSNDNEIAVNSKNLRNANETNNLLEYRKKYLSIDLKEEEKKLIQLRNKQKEYYKNNTGMFLDYKTINQEITQKSIASLDIDAEAIKAIIETNKERIKENKIVIEEKINKNTKLIEDIYFKVRDYCEKLGIVQIIKDNPSFLLTNKIKYYSGTDFSKLVIAFKLALHKEVEKYLNTSIPFIVDSPAGREMTEENYKLIIDLIDKELPKSQIIFASIYKIRSKKVLKFTKFAIENHK